MLYEHPIVLFDGICNLCNGSVDFILKHDKKRQFRLLALQDDKAKTLLEKYNIPDNVDSVVLVFSNKAITESEAIIKIAALLGFPWNLVRVFRIVPLKFRNKVYSWIARNRYRWFGTRTSCRIMKLDGS